jgi:8-oxo-dGTP diphosphatase
MSRTSTVELTNLCLIYRDDKILVEEKNWRGQKGIIFPGGHVEKGESLLSSVIREMQEETGLTIEHPIPCGFKDWINDDGSRYLVLLYKTDRFSGELRSSEEGRVFWTTREEFERLPVIWNMREILQILDADEYSEFFWPEGADEGVLLG